LGLDAAREVFHPESYSVVMKEALGKHLNTKTKESIDETNKQIEIMNEKLRKEEEAKNLRKCTILDQSEKYY
jgi:hypothetical protein